MFHLANTPTYLQIHLFSSSCLDVPAYPPGLPCSPAEIPCAQISLSSSHASFRNQPGSSSRRSRRTPLCLPRGPPGSLHYVPDYTAGYSGLFPSSLRRRIFQLFNYRAEDWQSGEHPKCCVLSPQIKNPPPQSAAAPGSIKVTATEAKHALNYIKHFP